MKLIKELGSSPDLPIPKRQDSMPDGGYDMKITRWFRTDVPFCI